VVDDGVGRLDTVGDLPCRHRAEQHDERGDNGPDQPEAAGLGRRGGLYSVHALGPGGTPSTTRRSEL
jgi:hypothetical protein